MILIFKKMLRICAHSLIKLYIYFFNCYLDAPQPPLGHSQGDNLTIQMLITTLKLFLP